MLNHCAFTVADHGAVVGAGTCHNFLQIEDIILPFPFSKHNVTVIIHQCLSLPVPCSTIVPWSVPIPERLLMVPCHSNNCEYQRNMMS